MTVTGYLSLYTTLLGWQQYNHLWEIAVGTGLIYLPFVAMVLRATFQPFTSMGAKDAAQIAVRRLTLSVITAFMVIAFAAVPMMPLDPKVLHFAPLCQDQAKDATPGHTGTTYDNAFPAPTGVKIPLFWYLVMAFSNGVTHAASSSLSCSPIDYRALHTQLDVAKIQDPQLKQEVGQFYSDCYAPAYSAYISHQLPPTQQAQIESSIEKNGKDDVGWLGSQTFLNVMGLYDAHNSAKPVNGFTFDANRDVEESQVKNHSQYGNPNCKEWWSDPTNGLQTKLKQSLPPTFWQKLTNIGGDKQQLENAAIRTLLIHETSNQSLSTMWRGYESLNDNDQSSHILRAVGSQVGVAYEALSFYPKLQLLINALPVIQGSLLFALYAFLALGIPFSSYRINFCVTGAVMIFSIIFCSFLWHLVQWFDNYLIQSLYPSLGNIQGMGLLNELNINPNQAFVDMIIATLYILLPLLWLSVMGWAGIQAGIQLGSMVGAMSGVANQAGERAASIVRKRLP